MRRRRRNPSQAASRVNSAVDTLGEIKWGPIVLWGGILIGAWYVWQHVLNPLSPTSVAGEGVSAISSGIADFWNSLTASPAMNVLGNVDLPNGQIVAISGITWKHDAAGNSYTMIGNQVYQLAARGADGNFTLAPYGGGGTVGSTGLTSNTGSTAFFQ